MKRKQTATDDDAALRKAIAAMSQKAIRELVAAERKG